MKLSPSTIFLGFLLLALAVEALSLLYWITFPYLPVLSPFGQIDSGVFHLLAPLSPILLILLLYSWIGILLFSHNNRVSRRLKILFGPVYEVIRTLRLSGGSLVKARLRIIDHPRILLALGMVAAFLLAVIPYRPDLNPAGKPVGVDPHYYIEWITPMLQKSFTDALTYAMGAARGSRPLILIPVYLVVSSKAVSLVQAVEGLPAILGPLLVLSVFMFVRESFGEERIAGIAGVVTAFSFNVTVGIWAGYYANMLALVLGYLFLTILVRYSKKPSTMGLALLLVLSLGMLLSHPLTWIIVLSLTTLLVITLRFHDRTRTLVKPLLVVMAADLIIDIMRAQLFGGPISTTDYVSVLSPGRAVTDQPIFWQELVSGLLGSYAGLLANAFILSLSLISVFSLGLGHLVKRQLIVWIALSSIPIAILSALAQTRIVYDLPIPVLTAIGLGLIMKRIEGRQLESNLVLVLALLALTNYAVRAVTSLVGPPF